MPSKSRYRTTHVAMGLLQSWRHTCQLSKGMLVVFSYSLVASDENTEHLKSLNAHLRHVGPLDVLPIDDLGTIKHDYKCKSEDVAEIAISNINDRSTKIDTCRKACVEDVGCQAWTVDSRQDRCWLKHSCHGGSKEYGFTSGFVNHAPLRQQVMAPAKVAPPQLVGVMADTNCWGYDIAEVVILGSTGMTPLRDAFTLACKEACLNHDECCAWTINKGTGGTQGNGHCWLKKSCRGVSFDIQARSGLKDCNNKADNNPSPATRRRRRRRGPTPAPPGPTPAPPGVAKHDVPLIAGIASAAAGASGIAIGLLAGLLAPQQNGSVIHNKLQSTTMMPNPGSTTSSVEVKPREGQSSGGAFLWLVPLLLGLFLLGCLLGPLAMRWYHTGCCCCGQDYEEMSEEEPKNIGPSQEATSPTSNSTSRQSRGAPLLATVPHGMMMQVPLIPVITVANFPPSISGMVGQSMPGAAMAMTPGSSAEAPAFTGQTTPRGNVRSLRASLRVAPGPPRGSPRSSVRSSRASSPMVSPQSSFRRSRVSDAHRHKRVGNHHPPGIPRGCSFAS